MKKLLIVEDEAVTASIIREIFESAGFGISGLVPTGEKAVEMALLHKPDMIIMDIQLAGDMDGIEALVEIRKSLDVPVIFMTGYEDAKIMKMAMDLNPVAYLVKPIVFRNMISILDEFFNK
jgi:CheY-like chemotaxis protein